VKQFLLLPAFFLVSAISLSAQPRSLSQESPRAVVEALVKMEINGSLFTVQGRQQAIPLFAHARPSLSEGSATVVGDVYSVRELWTRGNHAEVLVTYKDFGAIDSSLRYSARGVLFQKLVVRYDLILKGEGTGGKGSGQETSTPQWRIEMPGRNICVGLNAAIAHVRVARDKTSDPVVKKNAEMTLVQLKRFQP